LPFVRVVVPDHYTQEFRRIFGPRGPNSELQPGFSYDNIVIATTLVLWIADASLFQPIRDNLRG
jgi:hypothetical protein